MDRSPEHGPEKPKSIVLLSELPALFCAGLLPSVRQITIATEAPADMGWLDTPQCTAAVRVWLKANQYARLRLYVREPRLLAAVWPRLWAALTWYAHQVQALVPARENLADLDGVLFDGHSVIYKRRDAIEWHRLALARNAVAMAMAQQLISGIESASEQSLGTTGLAG
jgi:hypothetical protein